MIENDSVYAMKYDFLGDHGFLSLVTVPKI